MNKAVLSSFTVASALALACITTTSTHAGTISVVDLPATGTDAASGISTANSYLDAFDFGNNANVGSSLAINGVNFTHFTLAAQTTYTTTNTTDLYTGGGTLTLSGDGYNAPGNTPFNMSSSLTQGGLSSQADGNMFTLFTDMFYLARVGATNAWMTQNYGGLTKGDQYSLRIYYRYWGNTLGDRLVDFGFNGEGSVENYSLSEDGNQAAHYLEFDFTASSTTVSCVATNMTPGQSFILYGATLQDLTAVPEPTVAGVFGLGGLLLGLYSWRRARTSNS